MTHVWIARARFEIRVFRAEEARNTIEAWLRSTIESNLASRKNVRILMKLTYACTPLSSRACRAHVLHHATCKKLPYGTSMPDAHPSSLAIRRGCYFDAIFSLPVSRYSKWHRFRDLGRLRCTILWKWLTLNEEKRRFIAIRGMIGQIHAACVYDGFNSINNTS